MQTIVDNRKTFVLQVKPVYSVLLEYSFARGICQEKNLITFHNFP